jgi:hypothetical protein
MLRRRLSPVSGCCASSRTGVRRAWRLCGRHRGRWCWSGKGLVVTHIGPETGGDGLAEREQGDRGVVPCRRSAARTCASMSAWSGERVAAGRRCSGSGSGRVLRPCRCGDQLAEFHFQLIPQLAAALGRGAELVVPQLGGELDADIRGNGDHPRSTNGRRRRAAVPMLSTTRRRVPSGNTISTERSPPQAFARAGTPPAVQWPRPQEGLIRHGRAQSSASRPSAAFLRFRANPSSAARVRVERPTLTCLQG